MRHSVGIAGEISVPSIDSFVYITAMSYDKELLQFWQSMKPPNQHRVDPQLCQAPYSKKRPIFLQDGCLLPTYMMRSAPRCQNSYLKQICHEASQGLDDATPHSFYIPEANHGRSSIPPTPWLLTATNSTVTACGHIVMACGVIHTTANCMAGAFKQYLRNFNSFCSIDSGHFRGLDRGAAVQCPEPASAPTTDSVLFYPRVFILAEVDDTYVYHIHLEIIPRLVYHLDFLRKNPDVMLLYGCDHKRTKKQTEGGLKLGIKGMRLYLDALGIDADRLVVHKHVYANEIYLPMEGGCQDPVYNTWQILTMRRLFLESFHVDTSAATKRPVMLLVKRSSSSTSTRNSGDLVRQWSDGFTAELQTVLRAEFPSYDVVLYNDQDKQLMNCLECQVKLFASADVCIGMHGAGLSNIIYMRPNTAVVEFCPYGNDGRCLLGGGPFNRASILLAQDYLVVSTFISAIANEIF